MTDEPISLKNYKHKKKYAKVITDLKAIIRIYNLALSAFKFFSKYVIVQETMSVLQSNKVLLEINLKKLEKQPESVV